MCGIAGIVRFDGAPIEAETLRILSDALASRGPDDLGFLSWRAGAPPRVGRTPEPLPAATLGWAHRRLAILDLTEAGAQPMSTPDGRYHLAYNGEVYNYLELRKELEACGSRFRGHSDTEVLLAAWARHGQGVLTRLTGMFALAVLDTERRRLVLARDFLGIKPLYYVCSDRFFAFASEIKALLGLPGIRRQANPGRLYEYLRFGISDYGGETLLEGIGQVPAAHTIEIPLDGPSKPSPCRYWQPEVRTERRLSFDEAAEHLRDLFLESIRLHMRSDVPVGAALSGGVDSSAIVTAMRRVGGPHLSIHTFSYIASDPVLSEEKWVDVAGRAAKAEIHKVRPSPMQLQADLDRLIRVQDEPMSSTSMYAQYRVFSLARDHGIKVMLDGQGADEILGGYRYYVGARVTSLVRQGQWLEAAVLLARAACLPGPGGGLWFLPYTATFLLPDALKGPAMRLMGEAMMPAWMNADWFAERGVRPAIPRWSRRPEALREQLHQTLLRTSLPKLLRYEDRSSMAFSIESRVPFLTPALVNFCLSVPERYHIAPDGTGKALLRRAMRGIVPDEILARRDKIGFQTPERQWLAALRPWVAEAVHSNVARAIPALNPARVIREWEAVLAGRTRFDGRFWRIVNLIRWADALGVGFDG